MSYNAREGKKLLNPNETLSKNVSEKWNQVLSPNFKLKWQIKKFSLLWSLSKGVTL